MIGGFLSWWLEQLAGLLPRPGGALRPAADAVVISPVEPLAGGVRSVAVGVRRRGRESPLGRFPLAGELPGLPDLAGQPAVLRLAASDVLEKTLALPLAAERELDQALAFEMDRETPFTAEELYWNHVVAAVDRQNRRLSVRLSLLPKASLEPLLAALARRGITPTRVEIGETGVGDAFLPLDGNRGRGSRAAARSFRVAAACFAALALAAVAAPFVRQETVLAALDREIAAGKPAAGEAEALRREIDRLAGGAGLIARERGKLGRPLAALAAATRVLPDDTYLTDLELHRNKLTISGRSAVAARLIAALAADRRFRNPAFAAPVTRLGAVRAEVFTITAEVQP